MAMQVLTESSITLIIYIDTVYQEICKPHHVVPFAE